MDDTLEDKAPKARRKASAGTTRKSAPDAPAAKPRPRSATAKQAKPDEAAAPKAPARKRSKAASETTAKAAAATSDGIKPASKRPRRPAKPKQPQPSPGETPAQLPAVSEVAMHAEAPLPEEPQPAPAALPPTEAAVEQPAGDVAIHPVEPHAAAVHPHDEGLAFGLSPVDLAPDPRVREEAGLGWFIRILAISSVLLVLFNSFAIDKWSREQPVTKWNSQVLIAAQQLHAEMKSIHLDAPLEGMRSVWHRIKDARWPGEDGKRVSG